MNVARALSGTRWAGYDVYAHVDSSLHFDENLKNIRRQLGIQVRDRGVEELQIRAAEKARAKKLREDKNRQTGKFSNEVWDRRFQAMRPGKRFSRITGRRYYERRENRSDVGKLL